MIVRVSEARVRVGAREEFLEHLHALVSSFPDTYDGLLEHEVLVDAGDQTRIQYVSRWEDEAAIVNYAGADWRSRPVTFPDENRFLAEPLTLRHFHLSNRD